MGCQPNNATKFTIDSFKYPFVINSSTDTSPCLLDSLLLSYRQLTTLPDNIGNLSKLKVLWLLGNELITLPEDIGELNSLQELRL